ncbi:PP2C family protein-serine/threonine phosphatase [Fodinicurvata fenggangensis]|uniref:PP2C family protein-serine/threonine phosphatase n=1 Tax=Fodinicurvata fenggangensis TaxID=1121830 RepID=UPI00068A0C53|nr:PP2C family protein-serine/threonine phosphatase [Fodinicurvata fenggangensis]
MLLRTRISLIFLVGLVILALGLLWAADLRERESQARFTEVALTGQEALWQQLVGRESARLAELQAPLQSDRRLAMAAAEGTRSETGLALRAVLRQSGLAPDVVEVAAADGSVVHSNRMEVNAGRVLDLTSLAEVAAGTTLSGLWQDRSDRFLVVHAFPLSADTGDEEESLVVTLGSNAENLLQSFSRTLEAPAYLVNPRGRMVIGSDAELWDRLEPELPLRQASMETLPAGNSLYSLSSVPVEDLNEGQAGLLVTLRDATAPLSRLRSIELMTLLGGLAFLLLTALGMHLYLRSSFRPLEQSIDTLNALARQDQRDGQGQAGGDEIHRIGIAIGQLRRSLQSLSDLRLQRERQRRRQERLIRTRLQELAGALDSDSRNEIMEILENADQAQDTKGLADSAAQDHDLVFLANVLQLLSRRVTEQHQRLNDLIAELRDALITKTKLAGIQQELDIARRVQLALVPTDFPKLPGAEVQGGMTPAKEVGGDFFDFFQITEDSYALMVGDVSGKGVPAALFMAISRTLLRATARYERDPARCVKSVNDLLASENEQMLFVTLFYAIINIRTGRLDYVNAGHNPPLLVDDAGKSRYLPSTGDMALAVMDDVGFTNESLEVQPGETLLVFTDGITEAFNSENEAYGEDRLQVVAERLQKADGSVADWVGGLMADLEDFVGEAEQSDDITYLAIRTRSGEV